MKSNKMSENNSLEKFIFINYFVIFLVTLVFIFTLFFIYKNIYKTIDTTKNHVLVKINPEFKPIDFNLYDETLSSWNKKINKDKVEVSKDPFYNSIEDGTQILNTEEILEITEEVKTEVEIPEEEIIIEDDLILGEKEVSDPEKEKVEMFL